MNPEIRFRVQPEIYQMADRRAQDLGLSGAEAGKSAGVPLLARAALYQWLGLAWPEDLPRPKEGPPRVLPQGQACVTVHHSLSENYRRLCLEVQGQALPAACVTMLELDARSAPADIRRCLRLDEEGRLSGTLHLLEWETEGPVDLQQLNRFLAERGANCSPLEAGEWQQMLASWSQEHGSELLRARLEEGFSWLALAEQEWLDWRIQQALGERLSFEELRAEQSLAGPDWVHSLYPDREPSLERIQLLRGIRLKCQEIPGLRLALVKGSRERIESRRRTSEPPFTAVLWQLHSPTGRQIGLLSHISK
ncbi:hypothetical protein JST97_13060 [bacterium]|nr:hypothetical protein [bacterium]